KSLSLFSRFSFPSNKPPLIMIVLIFIFSIISIPFLLNTFYITTISEGESIYSNSLLISDSFPKNWDCGYLSLRKELLLLMFAVDINCDLTYRSGNTLLQNG